MYDHNDRCVGDVGRASARKTDPEPLHLDILNEIACYLETYRRRMCIGGILAEYTQGVAIASEFRGKDVGNLRLVCKEWSRVNPAHELPKEATDMAQLITSLIASLFHYKMFVVPLLAALNHNYPHCTVNVDTSARLPDTSVIEYKRAWTQVWWVKQWDEHRLIKRVLLVCSKKQHILDLPADIFVARVPEDKKSDWFPKLTTEALEQAITQATQYAQLSDNDRWQVSYAAFLRSGSTFPGKPGPVSPAH